MPTLIRAVQDLLRLKRAFSTIPIILLSLGGCAHTWVPGPGMSLTALEPAKARCSLMARHSGSSFEAYGSLRFVAAASLGHIIGDAIQSHEDFDDCMVAGGWQIASKEGNNEHDNRPRTNISEDFRQDSVGRFEFPASVRDILSASANCVRSVRSNPEFLSIQQYLGDTETGKYTMLQFSVTRRATSDEARTYATLIDQSHGCTNVAIAQINQVSPPFANLLEKYRQESDARALAVIRQQQTWGDYALQQDQAIHALSMQMKEASL